MLLGNNNASRAPHDRRRGSAAAAPVIARWRLLRIICTLVLHLMRDSVLDAVSCMSSTTRPSSFARFSRRQLLAPLPSSSPPLLFFLFSQIDYHVFFDDWHYMLQIIKLETWIHRCRQPQSGERHFIRRRILVVNQEQEEKWMSVSSKVICRKQQLGKPMASVVINPWYLGGLMRLP